MRMSIYPQPLNAINPHHIFTLTPHNDTVVLASSNSLAEMISIIASYRYDATQLLVVHNAVEGTNEVAQRYAIPPQTNPYAYIYAVNLDNRRKV